MLERVEALAELERRLRNQLPPPSECHEIEWDIRNVCGEETIATNMAYALNTGFPQFCEQEPPNDRIVSIIGSAPSLRFTHKDIIGDVWACNDAGWKLREYGIIPKYWMIWDPQPPSAHGSPYYCLRDMHKDTTFLVCSMCDPAVFDKLRDYNVVVWHPYAGDNLPIEEWLRGWESPCKQLVGFGLWIPKSKRGPGWYTTSAAVTRSAQFAPLMGYRDMHLHGVDSSTDRGLLHFELLYTDANAGDLLNYYSFWVGVDDIPASKRQYVTTGQMYRQIEEFIPLVKALNENGVKVTVHGSGAIPWLAMLKGWHVNNVSA